MVTKNNKALEPWMDTWYPRTGWQEVDCPPPYEERLPEGVEFDGTHCVGCQVIVGPHLFEDEDGYDSGRWRPLWEHDYVDGFVCEDCCIDAEEGLLGTSKSWVSGRDAAL